MAMATLIHCSRREGHGTWPPSLHLLLFRVGGMIRPCSHSSICQEEKGWRSCPPSHFRFSKLGVGYHDNTLLLLTKKEGIDHGHLPTLLLEFV